MKKIALSGIVSLVLILSLLFIGFLAGAEVDGDSSDNPLSGIGLSAEVLAYRPLVEQYCAEYGIADYVWYLLAIMQVESGGLVTDVMQASESPGLSLNSLTTEASIRRGCYYFSVLLASAETYGCDIDTVIQAYNYGGGFITYVASGGGSYTYELAVAFAGEKSGGVMVSYGNAIAVAKNGGWKYKYGNMFYVPLVRQYLGVSSSGDFIWPSADSAVITSVYGNRIHPVSGENKDHTGIDIGAAWGTPVLAAAGGTVILADYYGGYGNCVVIDHGNGYETLYGHMSELKVSAGDTVAQGQTIGLVGSTGNSTGTHIHWEVRCDGALTDPLGYFASGVYTYG